MLGDGSVGQRCVHGAWCEVGHRGRDPKQLPPPAFECLVCQRAQVCVSQVDRFEVGHRGPIQRPRRGQQSADPRRIRPLQPRLHAVGRRVPVHEAREVWNRFPVLQVDQGIHPPAEFSKSGPLAQVCHGGRGSGKAPHHDEIIALADRRALRPGHQRCEHCAHAAGRGIRVATDEQRLTVRGEGCRNLALCTGRPAREKPNCREKVLVVIVVRVITVGERLVGRGGEQQNFRVWVLEQCVREFRRITGFRVEQMPEALELVEDDEVGLQGIHAGLRERLAELRDQALIPVPQFTRHLLFASHLVAEFDESVKRAVGLDHPGKGVDDSRIGFAGELAQQRLHVPLVKASGVLHRAMHQQAGHTPVRISSIRDLVQDDREHRPLRRRTLPPSAITERCARCERNEIHLLAGIGCLLRQPAAFFRKQSESCRHADVLVAGDVEPAQVLRREIDVAAHVDDVDPVDVIDVLQVFDGACDHSARDNALAEAGLICHQEATGCGVSPLTVEPLKDVVNGIPLEPLESRHHCVDVDRAHEVPPVSSRCADQISVQSCSKPSGSTACASLSRR